MESVRLILEQIDEARKLFATGSVLNLPLAMILLDNADELVISRELQHRFAWDDHRYRAEGRDYTEKEREKADRFFDDKVRLAVRFGKLTKEQEAVLTACHQFRGEMFHGDLIRRAILRPSTSLLFHTVTEIFGQMPPQSWRLPARDDEEHEAFMVRFGLNSESFGLGVNLAQTIGVSLRAQVENEAAALPEALSIDLVERIDTTLANLAYLNEDSDDEREIDHHMRYGQFWQAEGWKLMEVGVREPEVTAAFEKWKAAGNAEFTIPRIKRWRRTSEGIARSEAPEALRTYRGVDEKFRPLEQSSGAILRDGEEIATRASLQRERDMIDLVNRGIGRCERLGGGETFVASERLNPEQERAVEFVLESRDRVVNISGAAGTGKTATLRELSRGLTDARREILAVAPTVSAVEELQKVGLGNAVTVERLLQDQSLQSTIRGKVIVLDEAGMVSARQMDAVLKIAERLSARVVFTGDTKQIQSVDAGDSLRILEKESRLKSVSLTQVQRQTVRDYREAIEELRVNPERGFEKLEAIGAVREVAHADRAQEVAKAFREAQSERNGSASVLVVCPTHEEINRVTDAIRSDRKKRRHLGASVQAAQHIGLNWTTAQKGDVRNFGAGQVLAFHRDVKGIGKNELVEVARVEGKHLIVRNASGAERKLTGKQARSFEVYESRAIEVSVGDRLLLAANRRDSEFRATNGELVTVAGVDEGQIRLEDGRALPSDYRQFSHGYAVTAHRSQGKSVDSVIISGDGMRKELFYVAASRGRQSVQIITSDREALKDTVARSTARKSASEFARQAGVVLERGARRGLSAARDLAKRNRCRHQQPEFIRRRIERQPTLVERPIKPERSRERGHERGIGR